MSPEGELKWDKTFNLRLGAVKYAISFLIILKYWLNEVWQELMIKIAKKVKGTYLSNDWRVNKHYSKINMKSQKIISFMVIKVKN